MGRCITAMRRWPLIKSRNRKLIRVTSSSECLKHMCVDLSDYNRYFNQIWHRTQIPYYQHAGMAKFIKNWESKMVAAAIVNFREMWITLDWTQISTAKFMGRCTTAMRRWPREIRNRKLIRVTSSDKGLKHMCVDLSDYSIYLNQIWHRTQIPYYQHYGMAKFTKTWESKMAAAAILNFGKMSMTLDWIYISTPNFMRRCTTTMRRWPSEQKSKPEVNSRDVIKWTSRA